MKFHLRPTWLFIFVAIFLAGSAQAAKTNDFFPIMPWNHAPNDVETLSKIKECGFTMAGFVAPNTLENCRKVGLKGIVNDARSGNYDWANPVDAKSARENITSLIKEVNGHPSVYGYYLRDEPPSTFFPALATVASLVHELAPGKWAYMNLFPNYAETYQLGAASYEEYIEKFVATCKPTQLSYDHYALLEGGALRDGYWKNLEQMRAAATKHNLPFWNIVLANAHFDYREPTLADLRFQVYSTLMYGGRGIAYFTYFAPQVGNYRAAAIDQFGHQTPTWSNLQNVNFQIQKLAPTVLQLKSDGVYHFSGLPTGTRGPTETSLIKHMGGEFAVGDFTHADGSRYVMVMNKSFTRSQPAHAEFRNPVNKLTLISAYTGSPIGFDGEQVWTAPGQGILLKVE